MKRDMKRMVMRTLLLCSAFVLIVGGFGNLFVVHTAIDAMGSSWVAEIGQKGADKLKASHNPELIISLVVAVWGVCILCYLQMTRKPRVCPGSVYHSPSPPRCPPRRRLDRDIATGRPPCYRCPPKGKV